VDETREVEVEISKTWMFWSEFSRKYKKMMKGVIKDEGGV